MSHMGISEAIKNRKRSSKPRTVYSISSDDEAPIRSKPKKKLNRLSNVMPVAKKDDKKKKQPVVVLEDIRNKPSPPKKQPTKPPPIVELSDSDDELKQTAKSDGKAKKRIISTSSSSDESDFEPLTKEETQVSSDDESFDVTKFESTVDDRTDSSPILSRTSPIIEKEVVAEEKATRDNNKLAQSSTSSIPASSLTTPDKACQVTKTQQSKRIVRDFHGRAFKPPRMGNNVSTRADLEANLRREMPIRDVDDRLSLFLILTAEMIILANLARFKSDYAALASLLSDLFPINCQNHDCCLFCIKRKKFRMPKSQLQFKVLSTYKQLLTLARGKPSIHRRIQNEYRQNKSIPRMQIQTIEHKLRMAENRIVALKEDSITNTGSSFTFSHSPKS